MIRNQMMIGSILKLKTGVSEDEYDEYEIKSKRGDGATCIAYDAFDKKTKEQVIVKEFYPDNLANCFTRQSDTNVLEFNQTDKIEEFIESKDDFLKGIDEYKKWWFINKDVMPFPDCISNKGSIETAYTISRLKDGNILKYRSIKGFSELTTDWLELILKIMISICDSVNLFHEKEYLYLDLKTENLFFVEDQDTDKVAVGFFDFDTVLPKREAQVFNKGFDFHTDNYAVGTILYFLLTGKEPSSADIQDNRVIFKRLKESEPLKDIPIQFFDNIEQIFEKTAYCKRTTCCCEEIIYIRNLLMQSYISLHFDKDFWRFNYHLVDESLVRLFTILNGIEIDFKVTEDWGLGIRDLSYLLELGVIKGKNSKYIMPSLTAQFLETILTPVSFEDYGFIDRVSCNLFGKIADSNDSFIRHENTFESDLEAIAYHLVGTRLIDFSIGYLEEFKNIIKHDRSNVCEIINNLLVCCLIYNNLCYRLLKKQTIIEICKKLDNLLNEYSYYPSQLILGLRGPFKVALSEISDYNAAGKKYLRKTIFKRNSNYKKVKKMDSLAKYIILDLPFLFKSWGSGLYYIAKFLLIFGPLYFKFKHITNSSNRNYSEFKKEKIKIVEDRIRRLLNKFLKNYSKSKKDITNSLTLNMCLEAYSIIARIYGLSGNVESAMISVEYLENDIIKCYYNRNIYGKIEIYEYIKDVYYSCGFLEDAKKYIQKIIDIYRSLDDDHKREEINLNLEFAHRAIVSEEYILAITCADLVYDWVMKTNDLNPINRIDYLYKLSLLYLDYILMLFEIDQKNQEYFSKAQKCTNIVINNMINLSDYEKFLAICNHAILTFLDGQSLEESKKMIKDASAQYKQEERYIQFKCLSFLFEVAGEFKNALDYKLKAYEKLKTSRNGYLDRLEEANCCLSIGDIYVKLNEISTAICFYEKAIENLKVRYSSQSKMVLTAIKKLNDTRNKKSI